MKKESGPLNIVILGLSITSSWGNGHATTYRGLVKELRKRGHTITFMEKDVPWYAQNRDMPEPPYCNTILYNSLDALKSNYAGLIRMADMVVVGSYVPEGVAVGEWVMKEASGIKAFYDIDTPVTLAKLERRDHEYISPGLIAAYDLYLSFTGGPILELLEQKYHSPAAKPLYCSVDPSLYYPDDIEQKWDLGYLGTYSDDRQPTVGSFLLEPAAQLPGQQFVIAGPKYKNVEQWPENVQHVPHLPPSKHHNFYNAQRFTLNVTRQDMIKAGYSPSVRLFEAAACGVPVISDYWKGLDSMFEPGTEILIAESAEDVMKYLTGISEKERSVIGQGARNQILRKHTSAHRAQELEQYAAALLKMKTVA